MEPPTHESQDYHARSLIGDCYTAPTLSDWLGTNEDKLTIDQIEQKYLALETLDGEWAYPAWQFIPGTKDTLPGLTQVLKTLSQGIDDGYSHALWLTGKVQDELDGKPVHEWLASGGDVEEVLRLARMDVASWVSP